MSKYTAGHFIPAARLRDDYPFSYNMEVTTAGNFDTQVDFVVEPGNDLKQTLHNHLVKVFDYYTYLGANKDKKLPGLSMVVRINLYSTELKGTRKTLALQSTEYLRLFNFKSPYEFILIESIDGLKYYLKKYKNDTLTVSYDCETTGLNPELNEIVGFTFAVQPKQGFYVPLNHKVDSHMNLPDEALTVFYEFMKRSNTVYMFNSRFDMRFLEWHKNKYDMSKCNVIDTMINVYLADPDWKGNNLKWAETHFLGYKRPDLGETMKLYNVQTFDTSQLSPKNLLFYAAQDGISTFELGHATDRFQKEFGLAGDLDQAILYPLMKMEDKQIRIDVEYLNKELASLKKRKDAVETKLTELTGGINLNSPKQKVELFESFGLDTGVKTKGGSMSVAQDAVDRLIDDLESSGKSYPEWLKYLGEFSKVNILHNTFFNALVEYTGVVGDRIRMNYRVGSTSTGRFSSGKEDGW